MRPGVRVIGLLLRSSVTIKPLWRSRPRRVQDHLPCSWARAVCWAGGELHRRESRVVSAPEARSRLVHAFSLEAEHSLAIERGALRAFTGQSRRGTRARAVPSARHRRDEGRGTALRMVSAGRGRRRVRSERIVADGYQAGSGTRNDPQLAQLWTCPRSWPNSSRRGGQKMWPFEISLVVSANGLPSGRTQPRPVPSLAMAFTPPVPLVDSQARYVPVRLAALARAWHALSAPARPQFPRALRER